MIFTVYMHHYETLCMKSVRGMAYYANTPKQIRTQWCTKQQGHQNTSVEDPEWINHWCNPRTLSRLCLCFKNKPGVRLLSPQGWNRQESPSREDIPGLWMQQPLLSITPRLEWGPNARGLYMTPLRSLSTVFTNSWIETSSVTAVRQTPPAPDNNSKTGMLYRRQRFSSWCHLSGSLCNCFLATALSIRFFIPLGYQCTSRSLYNHAFWMCLHEAMHQSEQIWHSPPGTKKTKWPFAKPHPKNATGQLWLSKRN